MLKRCQKESSFAQQSKQLGAALRRLGGTERAVELVEAAAEGRREIEL